MLGQITNTVRFCGDGARVLLLFLMNSVRSRSPSRTEKNGIVSGTLSPELKKTTPVVCPLQYIVCSVLVGAPVSPGRKPTQNNQTSATPADERLQSASSMTMTMTTQRSQNICRWRPGLTGMSAGVMTPRKKRICCTDVACSVGKVCTYTLLTTVCSTSDMRET